MVSWGDMTLPLHITTRVLPGNRIEVSSPELKVGDAVEVVVQSAARPGESEESVLDVIDSLGGHRAFRSAEEVRQYLQRERESWE